MSNINIVDSELQLNNYQSEDLLQKIDMLENLLDSKDNELKETNTQLKFYEDEAKKWKRRVGDLMDEAEHIKQHMQATIGNMASREDSHMDKHSQFMEWHDEEMKALSTHYEAESRRLKTQLESLRIEFKFSHDEMIRLTKCLEDSSAKIKFLTETCNSLTINGNMEISRLNANLRVIEQERSILHNQFMEVSQSKVELQSKIVMLMDDLEQAKLKNKSYRDDIKKLEAENDRLTASIKMGPRNVSTSLEGIDL